MKIRSSVLVACLVVVPLIAMFSHRVPSEARAAVATFLRDCAGGRRPAPARAAAEPTSEPRVLPPPTEPAAAGSSRASARVDEQEPGPVVVPIDAHGPAADILQRLRDLGAIAIDCRPLLGRAGHVASCQLPLDGEGQLVRVFQATGPDASAAADNLLRDVTSWKHGSTAGRPAALRF